MAHSAQAKKRIRQNEQRRLRNRSRRSEIRSLTKRLSAYVEGGDLKAAQELLPRLVSSLDKAAKTNLLHRNKVSREKSKAAVLVNRLQSS